ncbi:cystathionine gamma-synthase, converts cysteine into cystathionine, partial [Lepidopterella palustris CBS 459.81]
MSAKIETPSGHAIPPAPRHSITVHLPKWSSVLRFVERDPTLMATFKSMYPRMMIHRDIKMLTQKICEFVGAEGQACLLFPSPKSALECVSFATSASHGDDAMSTDEISISTFVIKNHICAVFFPAPKAMFMQAFWSNAGVGISSRFAEDNLKHVELLRKLSPNDPLPMVQESSAQSILRKRIAGLLERAPAGPPRQAKVAEGDVYLFQSGMAAIYRVHQYLLNEHNASTVLFGFAFHSTLHVFEDFGPGYKLLGLGTPEELDQLEAHLKEKAIEGKQVQAVWAEYPSNPLLITPDLGRLRKLADEYHFVLIIDDTIGSFCNVDVLGAADIVVTSLTKTFSGYADVLAASAVLNPSSKIYPRLKSMFQKFYSNDFYNGDAEALEQNSRDYLSRSTILNKNALRLVEYFQAQAADPESSVVRVYYPTIGWSAPNYKERMRPATEEFTPGYGCLFCVEFDTVEAIAAFYDNLNVHLGPHLGAHLTLAIPYVKILYGKELDWAAKYDLRETQIRISTGLEDTELLLEDFKVAVRAA